MVHLGCGKWMIVDSCLDPISKKAIAIQHLESLGVDLSADVKLIIATHWHDDHIKGISEVVSRCKSSKFCYSAALLQQEFLSLVSAYSGESSILDRETAGTREFANIVKILQDRIAQDSQYKQKLTPVISDRILYNSSTDGASCIVSSLSPADKSFHKALVSFSELIPREGSERLVLTHETTQNHNAVALWLKFNDINLLLGSDLECTGDCEEGWEAILRSDVRPQEKAFFFKIPHHGSPNAHHNDVWEHMITENPICLLTAYSRGRRPLPQDEDINRIKEFTSNIFFTSTSKKKPSKRDATVEKMIKSMTLNRERLSSKVGHVQVRMKGTDNVKVNLLPPAVQL